MSRVVSFALLLGLVVPMIVLAACQQATEVPPAAEPVEATMDEPAEAPPIEDVEEPEVDLPDVALEEPAAGAVDLPPVSPLEVTGDIVTAGSSTVFPLSERLAERFQMEGYDGQITIDSIGSGAGFERFCKAGETDISNASRPIKDKELASCAEIGREPIEFRVATDAIAVVVSTDNDFVTDVTMAELAQVFGDAEMWSNVRDDWPAEAIQRFIPGTDSGTFDFFVEEVHEEDLETILSSSRLQMSEDDNVLVQGVQGSPYAVGFFGYAYYDENQSTLNALSIEGVEASSESVDDGTYALARPLFVYSTAEIMAEKPQVADFLNFYMTYVNDEVVDVGYFPAAAEALDSSKRAWLDAVGQ